MKVPVERVSSWQLTLSPDEQQIVLRPWVTKPGDAEEPVQHFALSLPLARALQQHLAESVRLLEERSGDTPAPTERRRTHQRVPNDRRKTRRFEGSRSSQVTPEQLPDQALQQKRQK